MTQQMVALTARFEPAQQTLTALHQQFSDSALASVAGNVEEAKQRLTFADQNISKGRSLVSAPSSDQTGLVDAIRAAEVRSAVADAARRGRQRGHRHQPRDRRPARRNRRHPERNRFGRNAIAAGQHAPGRGTDHHSSGRASRPSRMPRPTGAPIPGCVHPAHQGRRRPRPAAGRRSPAARRAAESRLECSTRRCSPPSRASRRSRSSSTRGAAAWDRRRVPAGRGQSGTWRRPGPRRSSNPAEAIAHANGAATLAAQAQSLANDDVSVGAGQLRPPVRRRLGSGLGDRRHHHRQCAARWYGRRLGRRLRRRLGGGWGWRRSAARAADVVRRLLAVVGPQLRRRPLLARGIPPSRACVSPADTPAKSPEFAHAHAATARISSTSIRRTMSEGRRRTSSATTESKLQPTSRNAARF